MSLPYSTLVPNKPLKFTQSLRLSFQIMKMIV